MYSALSSEPTLGWHRSAQRTLVDRVPKGACLQDLPLETEAVEGMVHTVFLGERATHLPCSPAGLSWV